MVPEGNACSRNGGCKMTKIIDKRASAVFGKETGNNMIEQFDRVKPHVVPLDQMDTFVGVNLVTDFSKNPPVTVEKNRVVVKLVKKK